MADTDQPKMFRTLRGFLNGEEPDEANYFRFSATLRVHGDGVPFEEIGRQLAVEPTHLHRKGERRSPRAPAWRDDAALKRRFKVDVFCGYRSNCDTAGFQVSHNCLELFTALEVPFGVSVIIA